MRMRGTLNNCTAWLSADDTEDWAHEPGRAWPCSTLAGHAVRVEVSDGDLVDCAIDGDTEADCDGNELDAILVDFGIRNVNL